MKCKKFLSVLSMVVSISLPCGVCEAADRLALMRKKMNMCACVICLSALRCVLL